MAIEDAFVLGACLAASPTAPADVFYRYEELRRERTAVIVLRSHEVMGQSFSTAGLADQDKAVAAIVDDWQRQRARERLGWRYAYDATAIAV